jgi:RHS repeat-associated protein
MPVLELDAGKNTTASYVYGANGVIYRWVHLPGDDEYEYHHVNALGSVAIITDDNESVVARYEYDAFGAVRHQWGNSDNIRKFTGKEYDADVKLYYYGARYYDPYIGRFISRDPAGDGINWYVYCANNPLALVDPTGLEKIGDPRPVNDTEKEILRIVFGDCNAQILANEILIQKVTKDELMDIEAGAYVVGNIIHVAEDYDPSEPNFSGAVDAWIFTHEATHVWQHLTGYDKGGTGDYYYDSNQLLTLDLKNDEQAMAVADWAFIVWGFYRCGFTIDGSTQYIFPYNITYRVIRSLPGHFNNILHTDVRSMSFAANTVFHWYRRLIKQVRQPISWLGQNYPNPAT